MHRFVQKLHKGLRASLGFTIGTRGVLYAVFV